MVLGGRSVLSPKRSCGRFHQGFHHHGFHQGSTKVLTRKVPARFHHGFHQGSSTKVPPRVPPPWVPPGFHQSFAKVVPRLLKLRGLSGFLGQIRLGLPKGSAEGSTKVSPRFHQGSPSFVSPRFHQSFTKFAQVS